MHICDVSGGRSIPRGRELIAQRLAGGLFCKSLTNHEQQNDSKNEPIRAEAITEAHQCLVSASSPNMGGYKHFQLIKKSKIIPCMAIQRPLAMRLPLNPLEMAVEWPYRE
jgi:hypothetical protein